MAVETIFQSAIVADFLLPFLLMFVLVFAVLQKLKVLGGKTNLDGLISLAISLIFVGATYQKATVRNLILFLTVVLVLIFVSWMVWGFATGANETKLPEGKGIKIALGVLFVVTMTIGILWATGVDWPTIENSFDFLFKSGWSDSFWSNVAFIIVVGAALAFVLSQKGGDK